MKRVRWWWRFHPSPGRRTVWLGHTMVQSMAEAAERTKRGDELRVLVPWWWAISLYRSRRMAWRRAKKNNREHKRLMRKINQGSFPVAAPEASPLGPPRDYDG